jgi:hypothetical protein
MGQCTGKKVNSENAEIITTKRKSERIIILELRDEHSKSLKLTICPENTANMNKEMSTQRMLWPIRALYP